MNRYSIIVYPLIGKIHSNTPGLQESADDYIPLMKYLYPRRCTAITLRGRGSSDAPQQGYSLEHHTSDIESVVNHLGLDQFILMGFSRGVAYALNYTLMNVERIKGLVISDYPAHHSQLPTGWAEYMKSAPPWRGMQILDCMPEHVLHGIEKESKQVTFWEQLHTITCPVLILRGGKQGTLVSEEVGETYVSLLPKGRLVTLEESNHNIYEPNIETCAQHIHNSLESMN